MNLPLPTGEVDFVSERSEFTKSGEGTIVKVINGTKSNCHPEFISGSHHEQMLKQCKTNSRAKARLVSLYASAVQGDNVFVQGNKPCVIASVAKQSQNELTSNRLLRRFTPRNDVRVMKKCAFTLSEVLIVLAVLGVVAAMTIPDLIQDYKEKATVTAVKRIYSVLNQAVDMAVANNGPVETWDWGTYGYGQSAVNVFRENLKSNLRIEKDCGIGAGCWYNDFIKTLDGENPADGNMDTDVRFAKATLVDGTLFALFSYRTCNRTAGLEHTCGMSFVDINGKQAPNTWGKDVFGFWITTQGFIPFGTKDETWYTLCGNDYKGSQINGRGCTAWIIKKENMDYLRKNVYW